MGLIRLLLALSVALSHDGFTVMVNSSAAVQLFFLISGFYMALVLDTRYAPDLRGTLVFYTSRYLRLFPGYIAVLAATVALALYSGQLPFMDGPKFLGFLVEMPLGQAIFLVVANIVIILQDWFLFLYYTPGEGFHFTTAFWAFTPPRFEHAYHFLIVPQAWSLGIELLFYVCAPFLLRRRTSVLVALIALSLAIRIGTYAVFSVNDPWTYRFFPSELAIFLAGALAYRRYRATLDRPRSKPLEWAAFAAILAWVFTYPYIPFPIKHEFFTNQARLLGLMALLFLLMPAVFRLTRKSRLDDFLGSLSYPVYINHILVITALAFAEGGAAVAGPLHHALALAGWLVLAVMMVKLIDDPFTAWRGRLRDAMTRNHRGDGVAATPVPAP